MRTIFIWVAAAFVFANFYTMIAQKETLRAGGQTVFLKLAPVDPRSMMQGDYMALNYEITVQLNRDHYPRKEPDSGALIIRSDADQVGSFVRYDHGESLAPGEFRLKYGFKDGRGVIGAESFFIPEGSGSSYAGAAYGELKIESDGTPLLIALCDGTRHRLSLNSK